MTKLIALVLLSLSLFSCTKAKFSASNPEQLYKFAAPSIVKIVLPNKGSGTGFYVTDLMGRKVIVTNAHVCMTKSQLLKVQPSDGTLGFTGSASTLSYREDLCVINTPKGDNHPALSIAEHGVPFGNTVFVAGHPHGLPFTVTTGLAIGNQVIGVAYPQEFCKFGGEIILDMLRGIQCGKMMQSITITAAVYGGNSGGPLMNAYGEVIGVIFASGELGGSALPLEKLKAILRVNASK